MSERTAASPPSAESATHPAAAAPPLAGLCALAALIAMAVNQLVIPELRGSTRHLLYLPLGHLGRYAANLAVIAGMVALLASTFWALRLPAFLSVRRRLLGLAFLTLLLRAVVIATLFDRDETTKANVYFAVGAANALCVLAGMAVLDGARSLLARILAALATAAPMLCMVAVTLELTADVTLDPWKRRVHEVLAATSEFTYLALLLASPALLLPRSMRPRAVVARALGFAALIATFLGFYQAEHLLRADYAILLYHAQRVGLVLDRWPLAYALPFAVGLGSSVSAMAAGGAHFQAGAAIVLILSSGHAPEAPGRLLCMTLGFVLLGRAIISLEAPVAPASSPQL
jgi:hypothetical protein